MALELRIRKAKPEDIPRLWDFKKEHRAYDRSLLGPKFKIFFSWDVNDKGKGRETARLKKEVNDKDVLILVAEQRGELLGYSMAMIVKRNDEFVNPKNYQRTGYVSDLFVTKTARGRRISSGLLKDTLRWFEKNKINYAELHVFADNGQAIGIYQRFGFEPFRLQMKKKLKASKPS